MPSGSLVRPVQILGSYLGNNCPADLRSLGLPVCLANGTEVTLSYTPPRQYCSTLCTDQEAEPERFLQSSMRPSTDGSVPACHSTRKHSSPSASNPHNRSHRAQSSRNRCFHNSNGMGVMLTARNATPTLAARSAPIFAILLRRDISLVENPVQTCHNTPKQRM